MSRKWILGLLGVAASVFLIFFRIAMVSDVSVPARSFRPDSCPAPYDAPETLPCGMTISKAGRLGNWMGEYATLLALAERNGRRAVLLPEMAEALGANFHISLHPMHPAELDFWKPRWTTVRLNNWMEPRLDDLTDPFTFLTGYPNSWTFYHHLRPRILKEFRFRDHIVDRVREKLRALRNGSSSATFVGVHVRRTDYKSLMDGRWRGVMADGEFFREAFARFEARYPDARFLVVSDDMKWCEQNIDNSKGNVHFVGDRNTGAPIYDLALLAHCNHSVITMGTFGFWGAYLAGGEVIHYTNYTLPGSTFVNLKYDKWYLPEWTPIAADLSKFVEKPRAVKTASRGRLNASETLKPTVSSVQRTRHLP